MTTGSNARYSMPQASRQRRQRPPQMAEAPGRAATALVLLTG